MKKKPQWRKPGVAVLRDYEQFLFRAAPTVQDQIKRGLHKAAWNQFTHVCDCLMDR
jgi:hypothetical protein